MRQPAIVVATVCLGLAVPVELAARPAPAQESIEHFERIKAELTQCQPPDCSEEKAAELREALLATVVVVVRNHPEGNQAATQVLREMAEVLASDARFLPPGILLDSIIGLLRDTTPESLKKLTSIAREAGFRENTDKLLMLLEVARDLQEPNKREVLAKSIKLVLRYHPELGAKMSQEDPGILASDDLQEQLTALVRIMNGAQLAEFSALRESVSKRKLIHTSRRDMKVLAARTTSSPCSGAACEAANAFWSEFARMLVGQAPQGGTKAEVSSPARDYIKSAEGSLSEPDESKPISLECPNERYSELCDGPYAGVYVLDQSVASGTGSACSKVYYVAHGIDDKIHRSAEGGVGPVCVTDVSSARTEAATLAARVLRESVVDPDPKVQCPNLPVEPRPEPRHWWRNGWVRPAVWAAGLAGLVGGVYASNVKPESSVGDWLWRGGLAVSATGLTLELVYFEF